MLGNPAVVAGDFNTSGCDGCDSPVTPEQEVIDLTGALMLQSLSAELAREEVKLAIARDVGQVEDLIRSTGMEELLDNAYVSIREAVAGVSSGSVSPTGESSHSSPGQ